MTLRDTAVTALMVSLFLSQTPAVLQAQERLTHDRLRLQIAQLAHWVGQDDPPQTVRRSNTLFTTGGALVGVGAVTAMFAGMNTDLCPTSSERFAIVRTCPSEGSTTRMIGGLGLLGAGVALMIAGGRQVPVQVSPSRISVGYRWSWANTR